MIMIIALHLTLTWPYTARYSYVIITKKKNMNNMNNKLITVISIHTLSLNPYINIFISGLNTL